MRPLALVVVIAFASTGLPTASQPPESSRKAATPFTVVEATIHDIQQALGDGRTTSRALVLESLARIATYDRVLHAVMRVNPNALDEADRLDRERRAGRIRGPLHGVPIALKDNIHTVDIVTTGGALAFADFRPPYDATLTTRLREAGAIILAKTVMTELANWIAGGPLPMPGNYSSVGGYGMNPYDPRPDPRMGSNDGRPVMNTGGSSSGIGTAASFWVANVGTETSGSILSPANQTMLVGIKPTVGRISRYGIIPITADQDTAGPMARTVTDAAILLGVLEGTEPDPHDPATGGCRPPDGHDYTRGLTRTALAGARIGVPRAYYYGEVRVPGRERPAGGVSGAQRAVMAAAIEALKRAGATIVDPADIPSVLETDPAKNAVTWSVCSGVEGAKGRDAACSVVFKYGMKRDFNAWLASLGPAAPVPSLTALRLYNLEHARANAIRYGQSNLDISDEMDLVADQARYEADRARDLAVNATNGVDAALDGHRLDALLFPGSGGAAIAAKGGHPTVIVPFGTVPNAPTPSLPDGFGANDVPFGVSFTGRRCSEPRLIALAYAFEQATNARVPPVMPR